MNYQFTEIPYDILNRYGLTQEMVDDLPVDVLDEIYSGRPSPVLPVRVELSNGEIVKDRVRFSLTTRHDGVTDVAFHPVVKENSLSKFNAEQREKLVANKPVLAYLSETDKEQGRLTYFQLDPETKLVLSVPKEIIDRNLQIVAANHRLIPSEVKFIENGHVLTTLTDNNALSLGIDLNSKSGIRICNGNEEQWNELNKREWEKYTFGAFGCWVMDDSGNLDYINEDDYTDEIWNEQKYKGLRQSGQRV